MKITPDCFPGDTFSYLQEKTGTGFSCIVYAIVDDKQAIIHILSEGVSIEFIDGSNIFTDINVKAIAEDTQELSLEQISKILRILENNEFKSKKLSKSEMDDLYQQFLSRN